MDNLVIGGQRGVERILVAFRGGVLQSSQNAADFARPRCVEERYGGAAYRVLRNAAGIFEAAGLGDGGTGNRGAPQTSEAAKTTARTTRAASRLRSKDSCHIAIFPQGNAGRRRAIHHLPPRRCGNVLSRIRLSEIPNRQTCLVPRGGVQDGIVQPSRLPGGARLHRLARRRRGSRRIRIAHRLRVRRRGRLPLQQLQRDQSSPATRALDRQCRNRSRRRAGVRATHRREPPHQSRGRPSARAGGEDQRSRQPAPMAEPRRLQRFLPSMELRADYVARARDRGGLDLGSAPTAMRR